MSQKIKTSVEIDGSLTANSIVKSGGTASQILAADGSVVTAGSGVTISGGTISASGSAGVLSFNTRTGAVTLTSGDVTTALGYTPYNASNPAGYISSYTETDTLASVTARGATASVLSTFNDGVTIRRNLSTGQNIHTNILNNGGGYSSVVYIGSSPGADWLIGKDAYGVGNDKFQIGSWNGYSYIDITYNTTSGTINFPNNGGLTVNNNVILHAGNYSSYAVPTSRTITINGTSYDLSANRSWTVTASETDTLQTVTSRGNTSSNPIILRTSYPYMQFEDTVTGTTKFAWQQLGVTLAGSGAGGGGYFTTYSQDKPFGWTIGGNQGVMTIDTSGNVQALTSSRAPIFYDSNNTGFYLNPYGQSIFGSGDQYVLRLEHTATQGDFVDALYVQNNESGGRVQIGMSANGSDGQHHRVSLRAYKGSGNYEGTFGIALRQPSTAHVQRLTLTSPGDLTVDSSMRAPIFYDSNNTGYYLDPASTSNIVAMQVNGTLNVAGSNAQFWTTTGGGYQRVDARDDSTGARMHWYGVLNNGATSNFRHAWYDGTAYFGVTADSAFINFTRSGGGNITTDGSFRSPIFYDLNDTSYYADFNSTSNEAIRVRGGAYHGPNPTWGAYLLVGGDGRNGYMNNTLVASVCATDGNLHMDAASGKNMYLNYYDGATIYIGNGAESIIGTISSSGYFQISDSFRAPIFYDSSDTGYYWNPATDASHRFQTPYGYIDIGPKNTSYCHIYTDRGSFYFNAQLDVLGNRVLNAGNYSNYAWPLEGGWKPASLASSTRLRGATSPDGGEFGLAYSGGQIHPYADGFFYQNEGAYRVIDTNSVGSYAVLARTQSNWAGSGVIDNVVGLLSWKNYGSSHVIFDASNGTTPSGTSCSTTNPQNNWNSSFPTLMGWNGSNTYGVRVDAARYADSAGSVSNADTVDGYHGDTFYRNLGFGSGYPSWNLNTVDPDRSGFTYSNGGPWTGPFIHIGASGYGLQFNASYGGNGTGISYRTRNGDTGNWNSWFRMYSDSYRPYADDSGTTGQRSFNYLYASSYLESGGAVYGTIFYDNNNRGYYMDPDGTSQLSSIYTNNWVRVQGDSGVYSQDYGGHLRRPVNASHGTWEIFGYNKNGYAGMNVYDPQGYNNNYMHESGNGGLYQQNGNGWVFYHNRGNACLSVMTSTSSSSYKLYVGGSIYAEGDVVAYSDRRKKENIVTVDNALDTVNKLRGVYYNRIDDDSKKRQVGVIAQEIQEVLPEVVTYAKDLDEYGVSYGNITGLLIEAIKEQQTQIEELKELVNKLINK